MKVTKKILQRERLIAELCKQRNWNVNKLTPYQMDVLAKELVNQKSLIAK